MALCRRHEADSAVPMLVVVPVHQVRDPAPCGQQIFKRLDRQLGAVLQRWVKIRATIVMTQESTLVNTSPSWAVTQQSQLGGGLKVNISGTTD